jgi:UDP-2,3-diacylglucosamine pyrophosphatase LpxH
MMSEGPVLVISDTHFGFEDETTQRFQRFMIYLTDSVQSGHMIIKKSREPTELVLPQELCGESLDLPHKIILLGDIPDLWISRDSNTMRPYQQGFNPINSLIALKRDIIYLVGNHDWIMEHYSDDKPYQLPDRALFTVYRDGYPKLAADGRWKGERIGNRTYLFLHGHQFDPIFRHRSVLRFGDFMGFSSATAGGLRWFLVLGGVVFFLTLGIIFSPLSVNWLPSLLTSLAAWRLLQNPAFAVIALLVGWFVAAIVFFGVLWLFNVLARLYYGYSVWPGLKRKGESIKNMLRLPRKTLHQIIGTLRFDKVAQHIDADVVITGHTHVPEIYNPPNWPDMLVVNSGSWIKQRGNTPDTFVYIDERGPRLLQWCDGDRYVSQIGSRLS